MAVDNKHPEYAKWAKQAERNRLVFEGETALKEYNTYAMAKGDGETPILRRLSGQTKWEFAAYQDRAVLYPFAKRVRQAFNGAMFRNAPAIDIPTALEYLRDEATPYGTSLVQLMSTAADDVVGLGRYGVLVDIPEGQQSPLFIPYIGEKIINWRTGDVNGKQDTTLIVLEEIVSVEDPKDPFQEVDQVQHRVLRMAELENSKAKVYVQELWIDDRMVSQKMPLAAGKPLGYIPFVFFNTSDNQPKPQFSILYDLLTLNIHHYRWTAEEGNGLHFIALPTAWVSGTKAPGNSSVKPFSEKPVPPSLPNTDPGYAARERDREQIMAENKFNKQQSQEKTFHLGPTHLLDLGPTGAQAGILEHTGTGIKSIQDKMNTLVNQMASIGARLFSEHPENETATAVKIQKTSESNALMHLCNVIDEGFQDLLMYAADWLGVNDGGISVAVNREFVAQPLSPKEATELYDLFKAGGMDVDAYMNAYTKAGFYPNGFDLNAERERLLELQEEPEEETQEVIESVPDQPEE